MHVVAVSDYYNTTDDRGMRLHIQGQLLDTNYSDSYVSGTARIHYYTSKAKQV